MLNVAMSDVTEILQQIESGDPSAADQLLPLVYDELRKLAASRLTREKPGETMQATALVHEAYVRLVDVDQAQHWNSRGHFFAAAAEAMRRIMVERARRKKRTAGTKGPLAPDDIPAPLPMPADEVLAVDEALCRLESQDSLAARLVKLRFFVGMTMPQAADALGIPLRTAERNWTYAKTWLHRELAPNNGSGPT